VKAKVTFTTGESNWLGGLFSVHALKMLNASMVVAAAQWHDGIRIQLIKRLATIKMAF
jgi:hypothetical protein